MIAINIFGGEIPAVEDRLLPGGNAIRAVNCQLQRGCLEALAGPAKEKDIELEAKTIFKHKRNGWLCWDKNVSVVKSAIYDEDGPDALGCLFITGDREYPTVYCGKDKSVSRLGIPRPKKTLTIKLDTKASEKTVECLAFGGDSAADLPPRYGAEGELAEIVERDVDVEALAEAEDLESGGIERSSAYCYTYVQAIAGGAFTPESAPSPPTEVMDVPDGAGALISGFSALKLDGLAITHIRIYRTQSGEESGEFHFLDEIEVAGKDIGKLQYRDTTSDLDLSSEVLKTSTWDPIEDDAQGLIVTDNGIYACFRGNELLLSEPNYAYAFPADYRLLFEDKIVALAHYDNTIAVLTEGRPYLVVGNEPAQMQVIHLPIEQACVSAKSVGSVAGGVIYASPDGLMLFSASDQSLCSGGTFTREQWQELGPEGLAGTVLNGKYYGFLLGSNKGFIFTPGAKDIVRIELDKKCKVLALYHHSVDDCIYLSMERDGKYEIAKWEAGAKMKYEWRSKSFYFPMLTRMSAVRAQGEQSAEDELNVRIYGPDRDRERDSLYLRGNKAARIRPTRAERVWSLSLRGRRKVYEIRMGMSVESVEGGGA